MQSSVVQRWALGAALCLVPVLVSAQSGPSFGSVVSLGYTPSDVVIDESRQQLYIVNSSANRLDVYDYSGSRTAGTVPLGTYPLSAAMSPDHSALYVTNRDSSSLSVINLDRLSVDQMISLPAKPEGVAVGADGRVLITTQGTGTNNALNTLLLYDPTQSYGQQILSLPTPQAISTPTPLNQVFVGRPAVAFPGRLLATPDGQFVIGMVAINQTANSAQTTLFVYETASGVVLQSRIVTGQSSVLSISPDGSRFMAGSTLYDTATLAVMAQMNSANLPFYTQVLNNGTSGSNPTFNVQFNYGGSVFSSDATTVYSAFNNAANGARPAASVLYVANPNHLGVRLGLKLPQSILGKMVTTADGNKIFATSESGLISFQMDTLYQNPILQPDTTQVFIALDDCNKGLSKAQVKVSNLGAGKVTFSVPNVTAAVVSQLASGLAPSTITFSMEPGRSGVTRQPGTNLWTGAGTGNGAPIGIILLSNEAINYPNTINVYMNYRQSDQRGIIYPRPVSWSTTQGLQELVLDEKRGRVYITNAGLNRLEVFDTNKQAFIDPVEVGQLPRAMAMSLDGSTLYVGNTGGESITTVDLDSMAVIGKIDFPPIPRAGNQTTVQPIAMAMGLSGLQFVMSNGSFWRVIGNTATVRAANSVTPATLPSPQYMIGTPGGENILALGGTGIGYLYNALSDSWINSRQIYNQTPQSYFGSLAAGPLGSYYVVSGLILNSALAVLGGTERPGTTQTVAGVNPFQGTTSITVSAGSRNVAMASPIDENRFVRLTTPVRQNTTTTTRDDVRPTFELVDIRSGADNVVAVAPENPVQSVFGTTRVNVPARQMAVDSRGTAYTITLSGLSVVQLSIDGVAARPAISSNKGIVNSNDGTTNLRPGSFVTVNGANLALPATADTIPLPTVLGGTCVTFNDVAIPLFQTASGQISGQIPDTVKAGQNVVQVRSLGTAQQSDPVLITVQKTQ